MAERGVCVVNAILNRWIVQYSPGVARIVRKRKAKTAVSWRMDETYINPYDERLYLFHAVDRDGETLDLKLF